jgi:hypothetical protein
MILVYVHGLEVDSRCNYDDPTLNHKPFLSVSALSITIALTSAEQNKLC